MHLEGQLKAVIKDRADRGEGWRWRCADDAQLAGYVDGALNEPMRRDIERHLTECTRCLDQVSFLVRSSEWPEAYDVSADVIKKAKSLVAAPAKNTFRFDWRWVTATAAASLAILLIALFVVRTRAPQSEQDRTRVTVPQQQPNAVNSAPASPHENPAAVAQSNPPIKSNRPGHEQSVPLIRNGEVQNHTPNLLFPRDDSVVKREALICRWQKVPDASSYEVSIMTAAGDIIVSRQTGDESFTPPAELSLMPGTKYFVTVRAHLRDGRTLRSNVVSFHVAN